MDNLQVHITDATCYESYIRYPTDIKLLWESVSWLYPQMCTMYNNLGLRKPRSKYDKLFFRYFGYSKKRKRRHVETRVLKRSLLHLLNKLIGLTDTVIKRAKPCSRFHKRYSTIR